MALAPPLLPRSPKSSLKSRFALRWSPTSKQCKKKPDFVDLEAKIIYELKPFNKNGLRSGTKQLAKYKPLLEQKYGGTFITILEFY